MQGLAHSAHRFCLSLALVMLALLIARPASAQDETYTESVRAANTPFFRLAAGASVSETDMNRFALEPIATQGELGFQFTPSLSLGAGYQFGRYPKFDPDPGELHLVQGWLRYTVLPRRTFTHYMQVGGHVTLGGKEIASGLGLGIGLDYRVSRRVSTFIESNFNFIFPDDAVEQLVSGRARFTALGLFGAGTRIALRPSAIPPEIQAVDGPALLERAESGEFSAVVNDDASTPITYTWDFGDGTERRGERVDHAYMLEGNYTVTVTAENRGGKSTRTLELSVDERPLAARILDLSATTDAIETGESVEFEARVEGSTDISYTWDFGDGAPPITNTSNHQFTDGRIVGSLELGPSESHVFTRPGTYDIVLHAENEYGEDTERLTVTVEEHPCDAVDLEPVYFAFDRATLSDEARGAIERNAELIAGCPDRFVQIDGHADFVGSDGYNALLTMRRAEAVENYYRELGIAEERFIDRGLGRVTEDSCPEDAQDAGCQIHRRVDTFLLLETTLSGEPITSTEEE